MSAPNAPEPARSADGVVHGPVLVSRLRQRDGRPRGTLAFDDAQHGIASTYLNWQCRCRPCRRANTEYVWRKRARARGAL